MQSIHEEAVKLHRGFRVVHRLLQSEIRKQLPMGIERLTGAQSRMLDRLYQLERRNGHGVSLRQLAELLEVTPAAACEMVDALVQKKVVVREKDSEDRRAVSLRIVPEHFRKFEEIEKNLDQVFADFLTDFPADRREMALELMDQLIGSLQKRVAGKELI